MVELEAREQEHLFKVFRARKGDAVELLDGCGVVAEGVVSDGKKVLITKREEIPEPEEKLHLCCALPRKQKLDQLLKQAAELGAWSIRPVRCVRSVAEGGARERWDLLLREACKQSGNPFLPKVEKEEKLPQVLERLAAEKVTICYGSVTPAPADAVPGAEKAVLIGPEGGFAPEEMELMEKYNAVPLNFGPYVLRLETAAVSALTALRMLGALVLMMSVFFLAGCGEDKGNNPLIIKGNNLRQNHDPAGAKEYFLRAVAQNPDNPEAYLALAQVCDEDLNEPLEAIFAYRMYLKLIPADHPEKAHLAEILAGLQERSVRKLAGDMVPAAEYAALESELNRLRERNRKIEQKLIEQQRRLIELKRRVSAGGGVR